MFVFINLFIFSCSHVLMFSWSLLRFLSSVLMIYPSWSTHTGSVASSPLTSWTLSSTIVGEPSLASGWVSSPIPGATQLQAPPFPPSFFSTISGKTLRSLQSQSTQPIPRDPENGGKPPRPRQNPPRPRAIPLPGTPRGNPAPPRRGKGPKLRPCISEKSSIPPCPNMGLNDAGCGPLGWKPPNPRGPKPQPRFDPGNGTVVLKFSRCPESKLPRGENPPLRHAKCGASKPLPRDANPPLGQEGWSNGLDGGARSSRDSLGLHFGQETISPRCKHLKQDVSNLALQFPQCTGFSLLKTTTIVTWNTCTLFLSSAEFLMSSNSCRILQWKSKMFASSLLSPNACAILSSKYSLVTSAFRKWILLHSAKWLGKL